MRVDALHKKQKLSRRLTRMRQIKHRVFEGDQTFEKLSSCPDLRHPRYSAAKFPPVMKWTCALTKRALKNIFRLFFALGSPQKKLDLFILLVG